jgi:hypothetical protein
MRPTMHGRRGLVSLALAAAALVLASASVQAGGGAVTTEAGAYFDFLAPDPGGPTDGTIRFGFGGAVETIAADAVLVPPADTNLAFLGGGTPTCLEVTREGGTITRLAFVTDCTVSGTVTRVDDVFGAGADGYLIADRVAAPAELVEGEPPFAALIGVAAATGGTLNVTFQVDVATGVPGSFRGETSVTGPVSDLGGGDVGVGAAVLPGAIVDDASRALLDEAAALGVDATVEIVGLGTIQQKGQPALEIELTVTYSAPPPTPAPTPAALPDTGMAREGATAEGLAQVLIAAGAVVASVSAVLMARRRGGRAAD